MVDRLNRLLVDILQKESADAETLQFTQTFLSRYVGQGRPLSGYFMVCCVIETKWTVLAQVLAPPAAIRGPVSEAAAANKAWLSLTRNATLDLDVTDNKIRAALKSTIVYAMECFNDLLVQIQEMDCEPSLDTYAWETMSESLVSPFIDITVFLLMNWQKLASVCCIALRELDGKLYTSISLLLSVDAPISENLVQEAALKATAVLVRRWVEAISISASDI